MVALVMRAKPVFVVWYFFIGQDPEPTTCA